MKPLSEKEERFGGKSLYWGTDVALHIQRLKEKVLWGKNHGNGDVNSTKAILQFIHEEFGDCVLAENSEVKEKKYG